MSGFSTDWLALREPFDRLARDAANRAFDLPAWASRLRSGDPVLHVHDLACGTGANLRVLAPRLGGAQRWLMVDHDPALLAALPRQLGAWAGENGFAFRSDAGQIGIDGPGWRVEVQALRIDLVHALDAVPFGEAQLVTASALLDLVSAPWLDALVAHVEASGAAMLFALDVDGRLEWQPTDESDPAVQRLFAAHQRRDKGFGPALGSDAGAWAARRFTERGYEVVQVRSDWQVDGREGAHAVALLTAMVQGIGAAAIEQDPSSEALVNGWKARRLALCAGSSLRVGHVDIRGWSAEEGGLLTPR